MVNCYRCKTRVVTHLWVVGERLYCSASCERGGKSQFMKTYKALADMRKSKLRNEKPTDKLELSEDK